MMLTYFTSAVVVTSSACLNRELFWDMYFVFLLNIFVIKSINCSTSLILYLFDHTWYTESIEVPLSNTICSRKCKNIPSFPPHRNSFVQGVGVLPCVGVDPLQQHLPVHPHWEAVPHCLPVLQGVIPRMVSESLASQMSPAKLAS